MKIYADGGYHPKYKQAAYAFIIEDDSGNIFAQQVGMSNASNSRSAELLAAEIALDFANQFSQFSHEKIEFHTDYQGLIDGVRKKCETEEFARISSLIQNKDIEFIHLQGHRENNLVTRCDKLINSIWKKLKKEAV